MITSRQIAAVADYLQQRHDYGGEPGCSPRWQREQAEHEAEEILVTLRGCSDDEDTDS